jgi:hypothetical protein
MKRQNVGRGGSLEGESKYIEEDEQGFPLIFLNL